jgi:hypothetical protein
MSEPLLPFFQGMVVAAEHTVQPAGLSTLRDDAQKLSFYVRDASDCGVSEKVSLGHDWLLTRKTHPDATLDVGALLGKAIVNDAPPGDPPFSIVHIEDPSLRELVLGARVGIENLRPGRHLAPLPADNRWLFVLRERYRARGFSEDETYLLLGHEVVDRMLQRPLLGLFPARWRSRVPFGGFAQERYGFLRVETRPSEAAVWVDDASWGTSPQERAMRTGRYSIKASKETVGGVLAGAGRVSVGPGGRAQTLLNLA